MSRGHNRNNQGGGSGRRSDRRLRIIEQALGLVPHQEYPQEGAGMTSGVNLGAFNPQQMGAGMVGSNRRIVQVVPAQGQWNAVYATEDGKPFTQTVAAFALVEDRTIGRAIQRTVVPLTSSGRGLELADDAINYLGTAEPGVDAKQFEGEASTFAQRSKQLSVGPTGARIRQPSHEGHRRA